MKNSFRGIVILPIIIAIVAGLLLAVGGYFTYRAISGSDADKQAASTNDSADGAPIAPSGDLTELKVTSPDLDFSVSPIGSLDLGSLTNDLSLPGNPLSGLSFDTRVGGYTSDFNLTIPSATIAAPSTAGVKVTPVDVPTAPTTPPTGGTQPPSGGEQGSTTPTTANCVQFSSMPSAQYCSGIPDPNGQALCQACKAAGM